jgi:sugar O-acyltransferase (sialic acid O-acetyltransferase NeuD family)
MPREARRMTSIILIGAGGHARMIVDILKASGKSVDVVFDPLKPLWLNVEHRTDETTIDRDSSIVMGLGGTTPTRLKDRLTTLRGLIARGCEAPLVSHPSAIVSPSTKIGQGVQIAPGAIINAGATLEDGVIINTNAVVEHGAFIGAGSHLAPGAIVLAEAKIGSACMIGASAVILPRTHVEDGTLVPALTRFNT